jgi:predicted Zn-dependent protease with MMP-like domain
MRARKASGTEDAVRGWPSIAAGHVEERTMAAVMAMTRERFEELVAAALDTIPGELARLVDNVAIFVEDESPSDQPSLLGLYEGTPLTERGQWYAGALPDRITVFRRPILRISRSDADVVRQVRVTVVHEIAHHFGIDDDRLTELGYG